MHRSALVDLLMCSWVVRRYCAGHNGSHRYTHSQVQAVVVVNLVARLCTISKNGVCKLGEHTDIIKHVGESESCMVSKLPIIFKRTRVLARKVRSRAA